VAFKAACVNASHGMRGSTLTSQLTTDLPWSGVFLVGPEVVEGWVVMGLYTVSCCSMSYV
jgi:hypothetical protein